MGIVFDDGAADALISAADSADQALRSEGGMLGSAIDHAMEDFSGGYARLFVEACRARADDRGRLARVLAELADDVRDAKLKAQEEKSRQNDLDAWQQRTLVRGHDLLTGDLLHKSAALAGVIVDPMPSEMPVAAPTISAAFSARDRRRFAGGSGDAAKSSADPEKLRGFASQSRGSNNTLSAEYSRVSTAWSRFTASCSWVRIDAVSFVSGFEQLLSENAKDADWMERTAAAFEKAGGGSLADTALNGILIQYASPGQVSLTDIAALGAAQLKSWLGNVFNTALLKGLLSQPGLDPAVTAKWWNSLGQTVDAGEVTVGEKQLLLIDALPEIIGNLTGIPYGARDLANKRSLFAEKVRLDEALKNTPQYLDVNDPISGKSLHGLNQAWIDLHNQSQAIVAIELSLRPPKDGPARQLASFDPNNGKMLAAVALGNLDAAGNVTWNIPGMGTTAADGLESWTGSAQDLYDEQYNAMTPGERARGHAVISWVGYETPGMFPASLDVFKTDKALAGADKLATALDDFHLTRESQGSIAAIPKVDVVAHSYGTTTSAYALTRIAHKVDTVTFFGSAGIDRSAVPNAAAMHVAADASGAPEVYVTHATADQVAPIGILGSQPSSAPRADPIEPWFDGHVISAEGGYDPDTGHAYKRVTGHDAHGQKPSADLSGASVGHGYLDEGTESLHNIALSSTGHGKDIKPLIPLKDPELKQERHNTTVWGLHPDENDQPLKTLPGHKP
ncbi:alpha/beta hydrolase [Arthrobacter bambusae]|uniref:Pimeloyl-ACP methyl ester carboxylesterase n=1 Tax=Arthrobacter bambusae TaxID=1338426 RepID=A0AAW8DFM8_9MICC|nr:alpha/beta hydrolase [Arthrobacter bambusae]MDP9904707.1 pimeloyl-ACP methyl ester carboxylesterase [Arthrobacter bambusae]MDQ0129523.1 pimeloyl-ACP methyl ester carboxylesterase [Arthrobacter bambusae]MDQ0180864.1 pimeloyl-ACP methyl ester carboxylesterase [Arthrobacter bambusae]